MKFKRPLPSCHSLVWRQVLRKPAVLPHAPQSGLGLLQSIVPLDGSSASAYAFLATCVKEHGAVDASAELLELAAKAVPGNHSCVLLIRGAFGGGESDESLVHTRFRDC